MRKSILIAVLVLGLAGLTGGTTYLTPRAAQQSQLIEEHMYGGIPDTAQILVRNAYVISYNPERRVPNWVAYHIKPDYLKTPPRDGPFDDFHADPDVENPVKPSDYDGLFTTLGYDRGHLVPYAVSGGDRDGDGLYAIRDLNGDGEFTKTDKDANGQYVIDDPDDAETVYQVNYMSNIAPQNAYEFNRSSGLWYKLERWVQDDLVRDRGIEVWVITGSIFGPGEVEKVGPAEDIQVPPMFYKIVILKPSDGAGSPKVLAFLFPHQRESHGDIKDFLVPIDIIENLSGFDFFSAPDDGIDEELEKQDTWIFWEELPGDGR